MYKNHRIGIVVPAYNEEALIVDTLRGIPEYVDRIFIVNDGSTDHTLELVEQQSRQDSRISVINHQNNQGLGQSLIDGYLASRLSDVQITAVMAGDNQMNPDDLPSLLDPLIEKGYDYAKGNRLLHQDIDKMPRYRFWGNSILTILTKFATGYYSTMDPQCGYTAINNSTLARIPIEKMTKGYGYNADILCMLNIQKFRVTDVEVQPVYGLEKSKINVWKYTLKTSCLLIRLFFKRLIRRYLIKDFHPLVLFFFFAFFNTIFLVIPFTTMLIYLYFVEGEVERTTMLIVIFTVLITFQSALFAIWMDMDYNKE